MALENQMSIGSEKVPFSAHRALNEKFESTSLRQRVRCKPPLTRKCFQCVVRLNSAMMQLPGRGGKMPEVYVHASAMGR